MSNQRNSLAWCLNSTIISDIYEPTADITITCKTNVNEPLYTSTS